MGEPSSTQGNYPSKTHETSKKTIVSFKKFSLGKYFLTYFSKTYSRGKLINNNMRIIQIILQTIFTNNHRKIWDKHVSKNENLLLIEGLPDKMNSYVGFDNKRKAKNLSIDENSKHNINWQIWDNKPATSYKNVAYRQKIIDDKVEANELPTDFINQQRITLNVFKGTPGMGKTSAEKFGTFEVQKRSEVTLLLVYCSRLAEVLEMEMENAHYLSNTDDVLMILGKVLSNQNYDVLKNVYKNKNDDGFSIILYFDGIDKIPSKHINNVIKMLKIICSKKGMQVVMSTQDYDKTTLERHDETTIAASLLPLSAEDQENFLKQNFNVSNNENIENILKKLNSNTKDKFHVSQLIIKMLAETCSDYLQKNLHSSNEQDILSIIQLYEHIFKISFQMKYPDAKEDSDYLISEGFKIQHEMLALKLLDIKINEANNLEYLKLYEGFKKHFKSNPNCSALVIPSTNPIEIQFIHPSLCDYFAATFLYDHSYTLKDQLNNIFSQHKRVRVREIFNMMKKIDENNISINILKNVRLSSNLKIYGRRLLKFSGK